MLAIQAVIVFVGLAGKNPAKIEHQLAPMLAHAHVETRTLAPHELGILARHSDASKDVVAAMHVDGVVGGALIESGGRLTLRIVIYDADGNVKSIGETPLDGRALSKDDLDVLTDNVGQEIAALAARHPSTRPAPVAPVAPPSPNAEPDEINFDPDAAAPAPAPAAKKPATKPMAPPTEDLGMADTSSTPAAREHPAHEDAAPTETADAVSLDDVAALNADTAESTDTGGGAGDAAPTALAGELHMHIDAGVGLASRSFVGPSTLTGYSSSAVGTVQVAGGIEPTSSLAFTGMAERAIEMASPVGTEMASTSMSRWEIAAAYKLSRGSVSISPTIGVGQRDFAIDSAASARTPDAAYGYFLIGATGAIAVGDRLAIRAHGAFEPVSGDGATADMAYGPATRWAFDVGAGVEVHLHAHVVARAAVDYQRFAWEWAAAGTRAATSAADSYPSGTLSLGATY